MVSKAVTLVVFALASWGNERTAAQSTTTCTNGKKPLLWELSQGNERAYLVGSYNMPADDLKNQGSSNVYSDLDATIQQALKCSDIAYFQFGCDLADKSAQAVGNYMAHCAYYPIVDEQDAIADRLTEVQMTNLKDAIQKFTTLAPAACKTAVTTLLESAQNIVDNVTYRTTLLDLYHQSIEAINPLWCDPKDSQVQSYETFLRAQFGTNKPIFGLEDIGSECQVYQGNSVEQDAQLATAMASNFNNPIWVNNVTTMLGGMEQVMQCGDLTQLSQMMEFFKDLPLASERMMSERNTNLKYGIEEAIKSNPGRKLLFVLPVTHIIDAAGKQGVLSLLAADGISTTPAGDGTLDCQVSDFEAPGAMALGHCLKPPSQNQPTSCTAFEITFDNLLGGDSMYQRTKAEPDSCKTCINSTVQCQCETEWSNTGDFENLCKSTEVDGTFGNVYWLDMMRNPGSTRTGRRLAQKTVVGLFQNCYATSCDISELQSMATRNWYKDDPDLAVASVSIRRLGDPYGVAAADGGGGGGIAWFWYLLAVILVGLCIFGLIKVFLMPKKGSKNGRGRYSSDFSEADVGLKGDDNPDYEQMQPLSMGDGPADPGEPMRPQGGDVPQMQQAASPSRGMQMQPMPGASPSMQAYQGSMQAYSTNGAGYTAGAYTAPGQGFTPVGSQAGGRPQELQQPGGNLMAQAMQMSQQIEMTGSQAVRSLTASQYVPTYPQTSAPIQPTSYSVSYSQPQMGTPTYQPSHAQVYRQG